MEPESEADKFFECTEEETAAAGSVSLFSGNFMFKAQEQTLPPSFFLKTLKTRLARESHNFTLLLWLLNSPQVELSHSFRSESWVADPFLVFHPKMSKLYQGFLSIKNVPNEEPNISVDATLVGHDPDVWDSQTLYRCSIFPAILQRTKYDYFQMNKLTDEYRCQFKKIVSTFERHSEKHPKFAMIYLQQNLTLLTRAYIRDLFYDITFKYSSWAAHEGADGGPSEKLNLLKELQRYHKENTFILSHEPLSNFIAALDHMTCLNYASDDDIGNMLTYGIWIDAQRGIILLCNGIARTWDVMQLPSYSYQRKDDIAAFVTKYMLFCNLSVLETCMWFR